MVNQDQNDYKLPQGHAPGHAPNREMYITTYKLAVILGQYFNNLNKELTWRSVPSHLSKCSEW